MTSGDLQIMQHALGVGDYGDEKSYRNHFVTGPGCADYAACQRLVNANFMQISPLHNQLTGSNYCFFVTPQGTEYVALHSQKRPKLTRSQQNYQDYLDADSGYEFREWMGFKRRHSVRAAALEMPK